MKSITLVLLFTATHFCFAGGDTNNTAVSAPLVRFSGYLLKYDHPAGSPKALYCLQDRNQVQGNLLALWLVNVDLSHLEKDTAVLVEGTIHTKLIPVESISSSIPNLWEIWMEVKRYKVIQDFSDGDFNEPNLGTNAPANGSQLIRLEPTNSFGIYPLLNSEQRQDRGTNQPSLLSPGRPFISDADILNYSFAYHWITLTPEAAERFTRFQMHGLREPFVVMVNGEPIYEGAFHSPISSQIPGVPFIEVWGRDQFTRFTNLPPNTLCLYPPSGGPAWKPDLDPRSDDRIRRVFEALHKLN